LKPCSKIKAVANSDACLLLYEVKRKVEIAVAAQLDFRRRAKWMIGRVRAHLQLSSPGRFTGYTEE
jgi:hypothetical protein